MNSTQVVVGVCLVVLGVLVGMMKKVAVVQEAQLEELNNHE